MKLAHLIGNDVTITIDKPLIKPSILILAGNRLNGDLVWQCGGYYFVADEVDHVEGHNIYMKRLT